MARRVNIDEDGYQTVRRPRPRTFGQYMPEIFAVDAGKPYMKKIFPEDAGNSGDCITKELAVDAGEPYMKKISPEGAGKSGDCITKELSKKRFFGDSCFKKLCDHRSCKEKSRSSVKEICSVERVTKNLKGEVNEVTPGWERDRVQIDSGAIDTVAPKDVARAFEMKETMMSKRGIGFVAANGSSIKNYGEKKIVGYTDDGESVSMRGQCADVKKVLCSVHKMNLGGNVVVLDGAKSYMQHKESGQKTRINYEEGQYVMYLWLPAKEEEVQKETEKVLKGNRFAILAAESEQVFSRRV